MCSDTNNELANLGHIANFNKLLQDYKRNRQLYFKRGCTKYNDNFLDLTLRRVTKALMKTEGFTDMTRLPEFIDELPGIHAPKSAQNVCNALADFAEYLLEKYGSSGPGSRLLKPEQVLQSIKTFRKSMSKPARERQQAQLFFDFQELPGIDAFRDVKKSIMNLMEKLMSKVEYLKHVSVEDYQTLCSCLIAMLVFRNASRIAPPIYIRHEHVKQLCRGNEWEDYVMPLAPKKKVRRRK